MNREEIIDYDNLWDSMMKCCKSVGWKPTTKHVMLNGVEEIVRMGHQLESGTWKNGTPKPILITYPKRREGLSIPFRDRIYQRSINDIVLYPEMTRHFIYGNCACQQGKGTDFAIRLLRRHLWNFYTHYGREGYIVHTDIHGYYPNMSHAEVEKHFKKYLSPDVLRMVMDVLNSQYSGDVGFNPGSQMVQIAGISLLDPIDHYIKEQLHQHWYGRFMDDSWNLVHSERDAANYLDAVTRKLRAIGFEMNQEKTGITPLVKEFELLGYTYRMTETGKVIMQVKSENVKHERKHLYRLKRGGATKKKSNECLDGWAAHVARGSGNKVIQRTQQYNKNLWREEDAKISGKEDGAEGRKRDGKSESWADRSECEN